MPGAGEAWDWDFLAECEFACFAVVMECDAEEVFLQCIGRRAGAEGSAKTVTGPQSEAYEGPITLSSGKNAEEGAQDGDGEDGGRLFEGLPGGRSTDISGGRRISWEWKRWV